MVTVDFRGELSTVDRFEQLASLSNRNGWYWETDADLKFVWLSESVERITGVPAEWHYGKSRIELRAGSVNDADWQAHLKTLAAREQFEDFNFPRKGPDGTKWISTSGEPYFDEAGTFQGYRGIARDITDHYEAKQRSNLLELILDDIDESLSIWDDQDRLFYANKTFY